MGGTFLNGLHMSSGRGACLGLEMDVCGGKAAQSTRDWVLSTHWLPLTLSPFPGSGGQRDFVGKVDLDACESSLLNRHGIVSTPKEPFPPQVFENEKFVLNILGRNVRNFMNGGDRRGLLASDLLFFS